MRNTGCSSRTDGRACSAVRAARPNPGIPALFLAFVFTLASCTGEPQRETPPPVPVRTMRVTPEPPPRDLAYAGTVEGRTRVTIGTKLMGVISSLPFGEGARVKAGQVVVSLRSGDLKAKKAQVTAGRTEAVAALTNISGNYERIRELYAKKSATQKEFEDVQMAYDMAQAKVTSIDEMAKEIDDMLKYADIVSPIDGIIVGKFVEEGDLANPGMPLLAIEDTTTYVVKFSVPEGEIASIRTGDDVGVTVEAADPRTVIPATVDRVNPSGDPGSRQYHVRARLRVPPGLQIRSGMYGSVRIGTAGEDTGGAGIVAIPGELIVRRGQLEGVFIRTAGGESLLRWVRTGRRFSDGRVEILGGLSGGDEVITTSDPRIADGTRVGVAE